MKLRDANLQVNEKKTLSHIFLHAFCLHFLRILPTTFPEEALNVSQHSFLQEVSAGSSVTCNLPV